MKIRKSHILLTILVFLTATTGYSPAQVQNRRWRTIKGKPLVVFDWNCSLPSAYPGKALNRIVQATLKQEGFSGVGTWGDRAFVFDLNRDHKPEYFVPLDCGATGNCTWGVFTLKPLKLLGLIGGQYIYVHKRSGRYPDILTYTHMSASEGIISTFSFRKKKYVWLGDEYPTEVRGGIYGNPIPGFLKKARHGCKTLGY